MGSGAFGLDVMGAASVGVGSVDCWSSCFVTVAARRSPGASASVAAWWSVVAAVAGCSVATAAAAAAGRSADAVADECRSTSAAVPID